MLFLYGRTKIKTKVWLENTLISILEAERKVIQKKNPKNNLKSASKNKRSGGSTYYVMPEDKASLEILAELRGVNVKTLLRKYN